MVIFKKLLMGIAIAGAAVFGVAYISKRFGFSWGGFGEAGSAFAGLGTGFQTGISAFLSPRITPMIKPCAPLIGWSCGTPAAVKNLFYGTGSFETALVHGANR